MFWERSGHTATLLSNGRVLLSGGSLDNSSSELYDPKTGAFSSASSTWRVLGANTATLLTDGRVLIVGEGSDPVELYDPKTGKFDSTGSMTTPRYSGTGVRADFTATLLNDGRVLLAGGAQGNNHSIASADLYDPMTGKFGSTGSMTGARQDQTATLLPDGRVLIAGGGDGSQKAFSSAELYQP